MRLFYFSVLAMLFSTLSFHSAEAQIKEPVDWETSISQIEGNEYMLIFKADIDEGWKVYANDIEEGGPVPTDIYYDKKVGFSLTGEIEQLGKMEGPIFEPLFDMDLKWFKKKAILRQKVTLSQDDVRISGYLEYMTCNDVECLPPTEVPFDFAIGDPPPATEERSDAGQTEGARAGAGGDETEDSVEVVLEENGEAVALSDEEEEQQGLWGFFILGIGAGLIALLTPCVFPMIPLTVSFFTKSSKDRKKGIANALIYAASIILIFIILGFIITLTLGPDALNAMASNKYFNVAFFVIFIIFALSFFGLFELTIPSKWVNKADSVSEKGGLLGIFFMAFTLVLISFSCTAPIIGTILVLIADSGEFWAPLVGMLGFAGMLAIPFAVFAAFPGWLNSLPKSGGWLNTIKVCLGFVELALALKFLSVADLAYHWEILTRDIFIALWIILAVMLGLYLIGKVRFPHEQEMKTVSVPRMMMAILAFSFAIYLVPGLWGAPVKLLSGIAPPQHYQEFNLNQLQYKLKNLEFEVAQIEKQTSDPNSLENNTAGDAPVLAEFPPPPEGMECPHELDCFFDLGNAIEHAREVNKPLLIDFTGWSCVNCRKMEDYVWSKPEIWESLKRDYVLVSLYVDEKTSLPQEFQVSPFTGNQVRSYGKLWSDLQAVWFKTNSQPYYILFDPNIAELEAEYVDESMLVKPRGYTPNAEEYLSFLKEGVEAFNDRKFNQQAELLKIK